MPPPPPVADAARADVLTSGRGHVVRTADNGTATIDLASGSYPIEAAKAGYVDAKASIHVKSSS
jgi:hypothetical protein